MHTLDNFSNLYQVANESTVETLTVQRQILENQVVLSLFCNNAYDIVNKISDIVSNGSIPDLRSLHISPSTRPEIAVFANKQK